MNGSDLDDDFPEESRVISRVVTQETDNRSNHSDQNVQSDEEDAIDDGTEPGELSSSGDEEIELHN